MKNGEWPESSSITRAPCLRAVAICHAPSMAASRSVAITTSPSPNGAASSAMRPCGRKRANAQSERSRVQSGYMNAAQVSASGQ